VRGMQSAKPWEGGGIRLFPCVLASGATLHGGVLVGKGLVGEAHRFCRTSAFYVSVVDSETRRSPHHAGQCLSNIIAINRNGCPVDVFACISGEPGDQACDIDWLDPIC
jgi:hypothetical protein